MGRAARFGAALGQAAQMRGAATLEALGRSWGRTHGLGRGDDLGWWASRRDGPRRPGGRWVAPPSCTPKLARECRFVPLPGASRRR